MRRDAQKERVTHTQGERERETKSMAKDDGKAQMPYQRRKLFDHLNFWFQDLFWWNLRWMKVTKTQPRTTQQRKLPTTTTIEIETRLLKFVRLLSYQVISQNIFLDHCDAMHTLTPDNTIILFEGCALAMDRPLPKMDSTFAPEIQHFDTFV